MVSPSTEASTLPRGVDVSPLGRGAITTTMLKETMPRKTMSMYFFTASLFFLRKENMITPAIARRHYRRSAFRAARMLRAGGGAI